MIGRLIPWLLAIVLAASCLPARAFHGHGITCAADDGCSGAPSGPYTFQNPSFFSQTTGLGVTSAALGTFGYARQSGQVYGNTGANTGCPPFTLNCRPTWHVAFVDYPIGPSVSTLLDPTVSGNWGSNPGDCHQVSGAQYILCDATTSTNLSIGPFDFAAAGNATGHGLGFTINSTITGNCIIHDSRFVFEVGGSQPSYQTTASNAYTFAGCANLTFQNVIISVICADAAATCDPMGTGNYQTWGTHAGIQYLVNWTGAGGGTPNAGTLTLRYVGAFGGPTRLFSWGGVTNPGLLDVKYSYLEGSNAFTVLGGEQHGDLLVMGFNDYLCPTCGTGSKYSVKYTTIMQPASYLGSPYGSTGIVTFISPNGPYGTVNVTLASGSPCVQLNSGNVSGVTGGSLSGSSETITYSGGVDDFTGGSTALIFGITPSNWNSNVPLTVTAHSAGSLTVTNTSASGTYSSGGTLAGGPHLGDTINGSTTQTDFRNSASSPYTAKGAGYFVPQISSFTGDGVTCPTADWVLNQNSDRTETATLTAGAHALLASFDMENNVVIANGTNLNSINASVNQYATVGGSLTGSTETIDYSATSATIPSGIQVIINGVSPASWNGAFAVTGSATVTAGSEYSFTVTNPNATGSYSTAGTATLTENIQGILFDPTPSVTIYTDIGNFLDATGTTGWTGVAGGGSFNLRSGGGTGTYVGGSDVDMTTGALKSAY